MKAEFDRKDRLDAFLLLGSVAIALIILAIKPARSESGWEGSVRKEIGRTATTAVVTGSSVTPTAIFSASVSRPDGLVFNNTSSTVWLSTLTVAMNGTTHSAILFGVPLLSSTTFRLDGSYTGTFTFLCDKGVATCEVRKLETAVP